MNRTNVKAIIDLIMDDIVVKAEASTELARKEHKEASAKLMRDTVSKQLAKGVVISDDDIEVRFGFDKAHVVVPLPSAVSKKLRALEKQYGEVYIKIVSPMGNHRSHVSVPRADQPKYEALNRKLQSAALLMLTSADEEARELVKDIRAAIGKL